MDYTKSAFYIYPGDKTTFYYYVSYSGNYMTCNFVAVLFYKPIECSNVVKATTTPQRESQDLHVHIQLICTTFG